MSQEPCLLVSPVDKANRGKEGKIGAFGKRSLILEDKGKVGCDFCRNVVKCRQMPIDRGFQLYLSKEKAGLSKMSALGKGVLFLLLPSLVPHYPKTACRCSLKRKPIEEYLREVKTTKHMLAAIVGLCFRDSCDLREKKKKKSTRFDWRLSLPIPSSQARFT